MGIAAVTQLKRVVSPAKAQVPQKGSSASLLKRCISKAKGKALGIYCTPFSYRRILLARLAAFISEVEAGGIERRAIPSGSCTAADCFARIDAGQA